MAEKQEQLPDYKALYWEKNGTSYFYIKELSLLSSGPDTQSAYDELRQQKAQLFDKFEQAGEINNIPQPKGIRHERSLASQLKLFAAKTAIVTVLIVVVVYVTGLAIQSRVDHVAYRVEKAVAKLTPKGGRSFWSKLEKEIHKAASSKNTIPPEKQEKIVKSLRILVKRAKPFVDEIGPLFSVKQEESSGSGRAQ